MPDPRKAATLDQAARNPDGTYNGARALAWLSEVLKPGKGMSEDAVRDMWRQAREERERSRRIIDSFLVMT